MPDPTRPTRLAALAALGLTGTPTQAQITTAYRRLAKATHPDRTGRTDPHATERFTEITLAYRRLLPHTPASQTSQPSPRSSPPRFPTMSPARSRGASTGTSTAPPWSDPPLVAGPAVVTPSTDTTPYPRSRRFP
jgi:hypothetical protein